MRYQRLKRTLGSLLVILTTVSLLAGCDEAVSETPDSMPVKPVKLLAVKDYVVSATDNFLAEIDATKRAQLSFQVGGEIETFNVRMGQHVKKGELLAVLDSSDLSLALDSANARYSLAKTQWERAQQLYKKQLVSTDVYDQAETLFKAELAHYEQAKTELGYTQVVAPFDGVVAYTFAKQHQVVAAKQPILNIIDNTQLDVSFALPIHYVEQVGIDAISEQPLWVMMDSDPTTKIPGKFKELSTQPNIETNTYQATLTIVRPEHRNLLSGMTGHVLIAKAQSGLQLALPESAWVSRDEKEGTVWVLDEQTQRVAKTAVRLDGEGRIEQGLAVTDLVVVAGVESLSEGQEVKAWIREDGI